MDEVEEFRNAVNQMQAQVKALDEKYTRTLTYTERMYKAVMGSIDTDTGVPTPGLVQNQLQMMTTMYGDGKTQTEGLVQLVRQHQEVLHDMANRKTVEKADAADDGLKRVKWTAALVAGAVTFIGAVLTLVIEFLKH